MLIDGGDAGLAGRHKSPFCADVPVEFANAAADQAHLDAGNFLGNGKLADRYLAGPAAGLDTLVGIGKGILEGRLTAGVGGGGEGGVRFGLVERAIDGAGLRLVVSFVIVATLIASLLGGGEDGHAGSQS